MSLAFFALVFVVAVILRDAWRRRRVERMRSLDRQLLASMLRRANGR